MCECCAKAAAERAEQVRAWLAESRVGSLRPISVSVRNDETPWGEPSWVFEVLLADPEGGADTWEPEETSALYLGMREKALAIGLAGPWFLDYYSESDLAFLAGADTSSDDGDNSDCGQGRDAD